MAQHKRINPTLDEGLSGDLRAVYIATVRGEIRGMIENHDGSCSWSKANTLARSIEPLPMAAQTVIKFAYGETRRPDSYTIRSLAGVAGLELGFMPKGKRKPKGWIPFS